MTKTIKEDAPANAAGGGAVAGIGVGPQGEPGADKRRKRIIMAARAKAKCVTEEKHWNSWADWNNEYTDLLKKRNKHLRASEDHKSTPEARERAAKKHKDAIEAVRAHSEHPNRPSSGVMVNRSHRS